MDLPGSFTAPALYIIFISYLFRYFFPYGRLSCVAECSPATFLYLLLDSSGCFFFLSKPSIGVAEQMQHLYIFISFNSQSSCLGCLFIVYVFHCTSGMQHQPSNSPPLQWSLVLIGLIQVLFVNDTCIMNLNRPHERHPFPSQAHTHIHNTVYVLIDCVYVCVRAHMCVHVCVCVCVCVCYGIMGAYVSVCTFCKIAFSDSQSQLMLWTQIWDVNSILPVYSVILFMNILLNSCIQHRSWHSPKLIKCKCGSVYYLEIFQYIF